MSLVVERETKDRRSISQVTMSHPRKHHYRINRQILNTLILCTVLSLEQLGADISTVPFWDQVPENTQQILEAVDDSRDLFELIIEYANDLPVFVVATSLNMLADLGVDDVVPFLALDDRAHGLEILNTRVNLYLLQNRSEEARKLVEVLATLFPSYDTNTRLVEIYLSMGQFSKARTELSSYLRKHVMQSLNDYAKTLFLLTRILLVEERVDEIIAILKDYFEVDEDEVSNSLYHIQNADLLYRLLTSTENLRLENTTVIEKLRRILDSHRNSLIYTDLSRTYPDLRLLSISSDIDADFTGDAVHTLSSPEGVSVEVVAPSLESKSASEALLIQLGSFSIEENAKKYVHRVAKLSHQAFIHYNEGSYKVFIDPAHAQYRGTESSNNTQYLLLLLKEQGLEGFTVIDPR